MRMHVGFSFKPKVILIILGVLVLLVAVCVDAFADEVITPTNYATGTTVIVQTFPVDPSVSVDTYSYSRSTPTGLAAVVGAVFGNYEPLLQTDSAGNVSVVSGLAGLDWHWIVGVLLFSLVLWSFFRVVGVVFKHG